MDDGVSYELGSMWKVSVVEKLSCCCKKKKKKLHRRTEENLRRRLAKIGILDLLNKN